MKQEDTTIRDGRVKLEHLEQFKWRTESGPTRLKKAVISLQALLAFCSFFVPSHRRATIMNTYTGKVNVFRYQYYFFPLFLSFSFSSRRAR